MPMKTFRRAPARRTRVLMVAENTGYPSDTRVRLEALALTAAGFVVTVIAPNLDRGPSVSERRVLRSTLGIACA